MSNRSYRHVFIALAPTVGQAVRGQHPGVPLPEAAPHPFGIRPSWTGPPSGTRLTAGCQRATRQVLDFMVNGDTTPDGRPYLRAVPSR